MLFNGNVVHYLKLVRELGGRDDVVVSSRLIIIYIGLVNVAVGVVLYVWLCPTEVKQYASAAAYVQGDGPSLRGYPIETITKVLSEHGNEECHVRIFSLIYIRLAACTHHGSIVSCCHHVLTIGEA